MKDQLRKEMTEMMEADDWKTRERVKPLPDPRGYYYSRRRINVRRHGINKVHSCAPM
jgi:hypothetical protein